MDLEAAFTGSGGYFGSSPQIIRQKLFDIRGILFDWDGVFNDGRKGGDRASDFSESISMGINMLRFSFFLEHGHIPFTAIVTGEENAIAKELAMREHFDAVYFKVKDKKKILPELASKELSADTLAFVFDDILDLSLAKQTKLSCCIRNPAAPLFTELVKRDGVADYISGASGVHDGLREVCELLIGCNDNYDQTINDRVAYSEEYTTYLQKRNAVQTGLYRATQSGFESLE